MKKILFIIFVLLLIPAVALATYDAVNVSEAVSIILPGNGLSYTLQTTSILESIQINTDTIEFVMQANSVFEIQSSDGSNLSHTNSNGCQVLTDSCTNSVSTLKMQCSSGATISVTPGVAGSCRASPGGGGFFSGGGGGSSATTQVPDTSTVSAILNVNNPFILELTSASHTVSVINATDNLISLTISSKPLYITLSKNETKDVDTDGDGMTDLRITYSGFSASSLKPQLKFVELAASDRTAVAVIDEQEQTTGCSLQEGEAFKRDGSSAVYYVTKDCKKRAFTNSRVFFTYFNGWSDVNVVQQASLDNLVDDDLGFMPWGPKYDPKYGALVKIVSDPKVYLLLGTEKFWITDESVFNTLGYKWNWIEDIDEALLEKYTLGTEINYTDRHPNFTLIKYLNDPKVYRLEDGKKRHVVDEQAFESLGYRWDRIVIVEDSEEYADGEELSVE